ncbi:uncharacterized protein LOC144153320 [Haemaphysalis longicornis]
MANAKPVLLCAIVAPGRLPSGAKDTSWVPWRHLPAHGVCDYIILDTDVNPDGSYNESEYSFLRNYDTTAKLFTLAARPFHQLRATFRELPFLGSAAVLRRTMRVRGFGLLDGDSGTAGSAVTDGAIRDTVRLFSQDCLELIASVERPTSRFALTLSLRIDVFLDADLSNGDTEGVQGNGIFGSRCYGHTHQYVPQHSCPDAEEPDDESTSDEAAAECNLRTSISQKEWRVHTFETPTSIENKMIRAYRRLGPSKQRLLSWLIYNVTSYVADGPCPKGRTRIDRIRDVIQRFRH